MVTIVLSLEGHCKALQQRWTCPEKWPLWSLLYMGHLEPKAASAPTGCYGQQWSVSLSGDLHFWPREEMVLVWYFQRGVWSFSPVLERGQNRQAAGHSQQSLEVPFNGCFDLSSVQRIRISAQQCWKGIYRQSKTCL